MCHIDDMFYECIGGLHIQTFLREILPSVVHCNIPRVLPWVVLDVFVRHVTICNCLWGISIERIAPKDNLWWLALHKLCTTVYLLALMVDVGEWLGPIVVLILVEGMDHAFVLEPE